MKKIFKLIISCLCVMLPLIVVCIYTRNNPLNFMDEEAPYYLWNKEKANTTQSKYYGTIILGDSVANAAYIPEVLSDSTINLALGGTTPLENYYVLQDWLNHNPAPQACYISFMDFHLTLSDCFWKRTIYSHRFKIKQEIEMLKAAVAYNEPSIITGKYMQDFISYELRLPNKYITSLMNAGFNQRTEGNIAAQISNDLHGGRYIARGTNEYYSLDTITYGEFHLNPLFEDYYRKIIQLCIENSITVHIVKLPLPQNTIYTEEYKMQFEQYYDSLKRDYPDITVDWFDPYEQSYFADMNHMNTHGALRFTNELKTIHSGDFEGNSWTKEQIDAINDSILYENKVDQILKWIEGKDYTVVLCDTTEDIRFDTFYADNFEGIQLELYQFDSILSDSQRICFLSGVNSVDKHFSINDSENGLVVQLEGKEPQLWSVAPGSALNLVVIDNYNNSIICVKSFQYIDSSFSLIA